MGERSASVRWAFWITLGIGLALCLRISSVWAELPDTMASHFGMGGVPDAHMSKGPFFVFLAVSAGGSIAVVFASAFFIRRIPSRWINIPNREYWLATDERREVALDCIVRPLAWIGLLTAALLAVAVELALQANLDQTSFANDVFIVLLVGYFALVIAVLAWMFRELDRLATESG